jgi:hypothetical protein
MSLVPQPGAGRFSGIIAPNGSVIPLSPPPMCGQVPCNDEGIFAPNSLGGFANAPLASTASMSNSWHSYVCQGEKAVSDAKQIMDTLKDAGVGSEAIETLTEALKEHSALVVVAVVGGYMFYQINCQ